MQVDFVGRKACFAGCRIVCHSDGFKNTKQKRLQKGLHQSQKTVLFVVKAKGGRCNNRLSFSLYKIS
jgi:hypothetical protein